MCCLANSVIMALATITCGLNFVFKEEEEKKARGIKKKKLIPIHGNGTEEGTKHVFSVGKKAADLP